MKIDEKELREVPHIEIRRTDVRTVENVDVRANGIGAAAKFLASILEGREQESFLILCLDVTGKVIAWREVARGPADRVEVPTRELFRAALMMDANSIIVSHNHPSGDPRPSEADKFMTMRLRMAGEMVNVPVIDHIIIGGEGRWYSFAKDDFQSTKAMSMHGDREPPDL